MGKWSTSSDFGLRAVLLYRDEIVSDMVAPARKGPQRLGVNGTPVPGAPLEDDLPYHFEWIRSDLVRVRDQSGNQFEVSPSEPLTIKSGEVTLQCSVVAQFRHARYSMFGEGDLVLAVAIMAMTVFAMQAEMLMKLLAPAPTYASLSIEPTPELLVRLLREDLEGGGQVGGGDTGAAEIQAEMSHPDYYMPSGNDGDFSTVAGAEISGLENRVLTPDEFDSPAFQPLESVDSGVPLENILEGDAVVSIDEGVQEPQYFGEEDGLAEVDEGVELPSEEQEGWGFFDWYTASDSREDEGAVAAEIQAARERLAIDPTDPWALTQLGYYQYLGGDYESCIATYDRYMELYPDDPAGYNNIGLVFKRTEDYSREEAYYRIALAMDPQDVYVLNNLAVNLAHQDRFDEALRIMSDLYVLSPDDPYANLHRSKIQAAMGNPSEALQYLDEALAGMAALDTLHHIEFRQDIRVDPAFSEIRNTDSFENLLVRYYDDAAAPLLVGDGYGR